MRMDDDVLKVLVSQEDLQAKVAQMGRDISRDYEGKNLLLVSILKLSLIHISEPTRPY